MSGEGFDSMAGERVSKENSGARCPSVWTIGHSTRPIDEFTELLAVNRITRIVDVRSYPGSRRYPHFNQHDLFHTLKSIGIDYYHLAQLGGRRRSTASSTNIAWRNASFRAYADYMESADFLKGIGELLDLAYEKRTAIMCAESVWWRCHRALIADYLKVRGSIVTHIMDSGGTVEHPFTSAANIVDGQLSYKGLIPPEL